MVDWPGIVSRLNQLWRGALSRLKRKRYLAASMGDA